MMPAVPSAAPAVELLEPSDRGRVYEMSRRVRLGDVDRTGRMRLDAVARLLQDIATDDASAADLDRRFGWLVRRTLIETIRPASIGEPIEAATWCTGIGRSWAERRTRIMGTRGAAIDAVSLWVQVAVRTGRPTRIASDFLDAFQDAAAGRTVSSKLALPAPDQRAASAGRWTVRRTDLDPFGHVNNAATWCFLEEVGGLDDTDRIGRAEIEYLRPIEHSDRELEVLVATDGEDGRMLAWLMSGEHTAAAARWRPGLSLPDGDGVTTA